MAEKRITKQNVVLPGSERATPAGMQPVGHPDESEPTQLTITVRRRKPIPETVRRHLSRRDFAAHYGADPTDLEAVAQYCISQGMTVTSSDSARRSVIVSGPLGAATGAFEADVEVFRHSGRAFRARNGNLTVPPALDGIVEGIFGFDQRVQARTQFRWRKKSGIRPLATMPAASYSPLDVAEAYSFPAGDGTGQTIGIIELGGGYSQTDLDTFFSGLNISPSPSVTAVSVDGGTNSPSGNPNSADGEVDLDIEVAGAIAPAANFIVYFAPNTTQGFLDAITTAIHDSANNPSVISISWGGPEDSYAGQALTSFDQAFQDAKALGVTICIASGDNGSSDGDTDGNAHVDFPASSPNVLACGGTSLQASGGAITSETVWNDGASGGATGGGVSETFPVPSYQANANVPASVNSSQFAGRGVPDVCGDADPNTGYNVVIDSESGVVGGTSAVAPLWAGLIARINQQLGRKVGFLNPVLYPLQATAFNDITQGNNGAYAAGPGWDACSGLGSPIGTALLQALTAQVTPSS